MKRRNTLENPSNHLWPLKTVVMREQSILDAGRQSRGGGPGRHIEGTGHHRHRAHHRGLFVCGEGGMEGYCWEGG
ncbi:hypothetical protein E2C01_063642 [Portunus trituberculatus]|uniref:Uncharacterized protein n=1 Tax=Portunus trituberculatus TaxID=210409 RepID=A0A5B7HL16_PORTR|nr:hypothetical protein [Portunus trituberculatus]